MKNTRNPLTIKRYTLVELLTVIAIIAVLAGMSMAGVNYARKQARITKARADIANLVTAIKSYESTYQILPVAVPDNGTGGTVWRNTRTDHKPDKAKDDSVSYDILVQTLAKRNIESTRVVDASAKEKKDALGNRRNIRFLDVPQDFAEKGFFDPWGNRYAIIFNSSYDDDGVEFDSKKLHGSVFVYSFGPNGEDDEGRNSATGGDGGTDDICSWK